MNSQPSTRRTFYQRLIYGLSSLIGAALALPALGYLFVPGKTRRETDWIDAGTLSSLPSAEPAQLVLQRQRADGWKIITERTTAWVVKTGQDVVAFAPHCTHLGCGYRWEEKTKQFLCPCHNSVFAPDGSVVSGPAPRPLDRYEVRVEGERLWLGPIAPVDGGEDA